MRFLTLQTGQLLTFTLEQWVAIPLYWAGFTQSLMWKDFTPDGVLRYPNFLETVVQILPMYKLRVVGGSLYFIGVIVMIYNLWKTAASGKFIGDEAAEAAPLEKIAPASHGHWHRWIERRPV